MLHAYVPSLGFETVHALETVQVTVRRHFNTMVTVAASVQYLVAGSVCLADVENFGSDCGVQNGRFEHFGQYEVFS